jgi:transcriptional regulator with XRE-family HTH domain
MTGTSPCDPAPMQEELLKELGRRIRDRRKALGLSQEELAAFADVDRSYMGGVERGERNISFTRLCDIARALQCDLDMLCARLPSALEV